MGHIVSVHLHKPLGSSLPPRGSQATKCNLGEDATHATPFVTLGTKVMTTEYDSSKLPEDRQSEQMNRTDNLSVQIRHYNRHVQ